MNTEFKGTKVSDESKFESRDFVDYDFTKLDLTDVVFNPDYALGNNNTNQ